MNRPPGADDAGCQGRTWGKCLAPLARARLPGQGRRSLSYRLDPAGEPADDLRQREEHGDEVAVYPELSD
jgi:hypothetical protein